MRCSLPEHPRTLLFTTLLFILSFTATLAESANVHGFRAHHAWRRRAPLDAIVRDKVPTLTTQSVVLPTIASVLSSVLSTTPTSLPSVLPTLQSPSTPSPSLPSPPDNPFSTTSSSSSSTPASIPTTSTSTTSAAISVTSHTTPVSYSTSSQSSSSEPNSSSQSSSSAKPSTSTSASALAAVVTTTPAAQPLGLTSVYTGTFTSFATGTTASSTPSSTSSSNSGFFSNTGAVAGTFTVAGLLGVAGIIGAGMLIARRRASRSPFEDDMEYLEKKPEPSVEPSQSQNFVVGDAEESSDIDHFGNSMEVAVPPTAHFYSQQDVYHGQAANSHEGYENQGYYPQETYTPHEYGIAYPPTESYTAEDPYGGMDETDGGMPNPFDDDGSGLPAALRPSVQRARTLIPPPAAYRSPDLHLSIDSFYGSSTGASNGHAM